MECEAKGSRQDKWQEEAVCELAFKGRGRKMGKKKKKKVIQLDVLIL